MIAPQSLLFLELWGLCGTGSFTFRIGKKVKKEMVLEKRPKEKVETQRKKERGIQKEKEKEERGKNERKREEEGWREFIGKDWQ